MSSLVNGIKAEAETEEDADLQKRLLAAAKNLADATSKMVEAAKVCSSKKETTGIFGKQCLVP